MSSADIDDLKICYILKDENNATSDVFSFTVEDNGKSFKNKNGIDFTRKWNVWFDYAFRTIHEHSKVKNNAAQIIWILEWYNVLWF